MALQCNIGAKGKFLRLVSGIVMSIIGGALVLAWARTAQTPLSWGVSGAVVLAGLFQVFEGWAGWCVVRAMGFKTRI